MGSRYKNIALISGTANPDLAKGISEYLKIPLADRIIDRFKDGEHRVKIKENIRGKDTYIIQPTCYPQADNLMELLITIDTAKRASAEKVTAVIPYFGYARQDRKSSSREPITARLVADLITTAGADRVITVDLHANQIQGFFNIPLDHLTAVGYIMDHFDFNGLNKFDYVLVSPDLGADKRINDIVEYWKIEAAVINEKRPKDKKDTVEEVGEILGNVRGKNTITIEDIVGSCSKLEPTVRLLRENGAKDIYFCCTHPVLCGDAVKIINGSGIKEFITTDTIPTKGKNVENMVVLTLAPLIGEAIKRVHNHKSIHSLFPFEK
ncbi:MAG: ribose-phosphate pyrophosphokinase [Nanoarchaeota archaeon]|nr:ribose-phosphate pyrophosphokinase [Nanoarchaeota archaeon]